jgi:hypothetical protein
VYPLLVSVNAFKIKSAFFAVSSRGGKRNLHNEESRSKLEASLLAGIFVGEEIDYTGVGHTPIRKRAYNFFGGGKISGASSGYGPRLPINIPQGRAPRYVVLIMYWTRV